MIKYTSGSYGFSTLFRIHGSAAYKSLVPSLVSSIIFVILYQLVVLNGENGDEKLFLHPYPMGALIAALTFLLSFRANFAYNRYWESITSVYQMHSKWLDVGMELAAFHLQSKVYNARKPPSFGTYPEIHSLERTRDRFNELSLQELEQQLIQLEKEEENNNNNSIHSSNKSNGFFRSTVSKLSLRKRRNKRQSKNDNNNNDNNNGKNKVNNNNNNKTNKKSVAAKSKQPHVHPLTKSINAVAVKNSAPNNTQSNNNNNALYNPFNFTNWFTINPKGSLQTPTIQQIAENSVVKASETNQIRAWDNDKPPLFLQEGAHLLSLLSAVAFSTLRNDLEQADSPLIPFTPNAPWPHVDPDAYMADVRKDWSVSKHRSLTVLQYLLGWSRTSTARTLYNAARPFRVVGGVSDGEIALLQAARGPLAKVALCTMWLEEFISREYLAGSTGDVAPPIISRLYQFISDGMIGYNQARKVAYIPFPFPHAQITSLFVLVVVAFMPILMLSFLTNEAFGFCLNFLTVMCFTGLHEVARELENPFQNCPNDVPLNNFQAQFNESLMQMFSGYHPDAYWEVVANDENNNNKNESNNSKGNNNEVVLESVIEEENVEQQKDEVGEEIEVDINDTAVNAESDDVAEKV